MAADKLSSERKKEIDQVIKGLPLFLPYYDRDLCELRVRPKEVCDHYHYDQKDSDEFDYWSIKFARPLRVVHLDNLVQWLRDKGVSEHVLSQIPKENTPCPEQQVEEQEELKMWYALSGKST